MHGTESVLRRGAALRAEDVSKSFDGKPVLHDISFEAAPGSFVSIVGRSGCGKSTLLRLLVGLDAPSGGVVATDAGAAKRIIFQEPRLLPWADIAANVALGAGADARTAQTQALAALQDVGLADRAGDWPRVLSGGQRQRVALARALVSRPRLLALDEPLGALDALTRIDMQALIENVWRLQGFTAVLVTHDVSEAVTLSDRIIVLETGRIVLDVDVDLPRPRHRGDPEFGRIEREVLGRLLQR
ncbi:MAG: ATP-binding cassette domain-containing protein [Pseudomonadota bacterium]